MDHVKTAGIVCDNYKVSAFEKNLTDAGFKNFTKTKFSNNETIIKVVVPTADIEKVAKVIKDTEQEFIKRKSKLN